jgi:hypothetical protein
MTEFRNLAKDVYVILQAPLPLPTITILAVVLNQLFDLDIAYRKLRKRFVVRKKPA